MHNTVRNLGSSAAKINSSHLMEFCSFGSRKKFVDLIKFITHALLNFCILCLFFPHHPPVVTLVKSLTRKLASWRDTSFLCIFGRLGCERTVSKKCPFRSWVLKELWRYVRKIMPHNSNQSFPRAYLRLFAFKCALLFPDVEFSVEMS